MLEKEKRVDYTFSKFLMQNLEKSPYISENQGTTNSVNCSQNLN